MKTTTKFLIGAMLMASAMFIGHLTDTGPLEAAAATLACTGLAVAVPRMARQGRTSFRMGAMVFSTVLNTTLLNAAFGTEYRDGSKGLKDLRQDLYHSATFDQQFTLDYTKLTIWERAISSSTAVAQNFQSGWTPNGEFTFRPSIIPMFHIKTDVELLSSEILRGFVGFLHDEKKQQNAQDLIKYITAHHLTQQLVEDNELKLAWNGVYVAHTPDTASPVGQAMNGVYTVINDAITAGTIDPVTVGAMPAGVTDSDLKALVGYIEEFGRQIDIRCRFSPMDLNVSVDTYTRFQQGMLLKYNANWGQADILDRILLQRNIKLVPQVAMGTSTKIWCTPKGNAIKAVNPNPDGSKQPLFSFETIDRRVKVWSHWLQGYGFWNHKQVFTNDVELVPQS